MIFPSTIIVSSDPTLLSKKLNELCKKLNNKISANNPDIFTIGPLSGWGIDTVRAINSFLSKKPFQHLNKIVLIRDAQNLQTEAQNALLKNLEEPGADNFIILTTNNSASLLPTIISRCEVIKIRSFSLSAPPQALVITGFPATDFLTSDQIAQHKEDVLSYLEGQISLFQKKLIKNPSKETGLQIKKIIKAIQMIKSNVDPKSALDYIMLA
ncbi:MAG: hypothetical protein WC841_02620 [Candidatus Shapirobacteria bacterium]|jgi:DNA polymerase III delta prime subunit